MSGDRWLLNAVPMWLLAPMFIGGLAVLAVAGALLVRRRVEGARSGQFQETAKTVLAQLLALYSLVLAFVVVTENQSYTEARVNVQSEALNIEDFYRATLGLGDPAAQRLTATIRDYVRTVVNEEWELLSEAGSSPRAAKALNRMYEIMRSYRPADNREQSLYNASLQYLHSAHEARHRRVDTAANALPPVLAAFLLVGALAILAVSSLLGGGRRHDLLVPMSLGCMLGFTLLLALTLEYPFSGSNAIPSTHFQTGQLADFFPPAP